MHHAINKYQLRLDVQHFLWPVYTTLYYYAGPLSCINYSHAYVLCREDRYLLFITENYAALRILEHFLLGDLSEEKPLVLFGSRFPKENEFTKVIATLLVYHHILVLMRLRYLHGNE